ncbi:MAG: M23 family metallopeptidase [Elusimicrobia bacterium]|nr:M23 family metallopeptidase [Elusimicrobiota bacterium]
MTRPPWRGALAAGAALLLAWAARESAARTTSQSEWERFSVLTPAGPEEPSPEVFRLVKRLIYAEHKIVKGEYSAWHLAKAYGTTAMALQSTRGDEMIILYPGMKVMVHNKDGMLYQVKGERETLEGVIARFQPDPHAARKFKEAVIQANSFPASAMLGPFPLEKGELVLLPKVRVNFDTFRFPFAEAGWHRVSSRFGMRTHPVLGRRRFHEGIDLAKPYGAPVYPSRSGRVVEAGWKEGYGLTIVVKHFDGSTTLYGHLSKVAVKKGQVVQRGKSVLGRVGSSGLATGPHLHFEMHDKNGKLINPMTKIGRR